MTNKDESERLERDRLEMARTVESFARSDAQRAEQAEAEPTKTVDESERLERDRLMFADWIKSLTAAR
jgi:hypothetical protein